MAAVTFILAAVLADSDESGWIKLIPFAIGLLIWAFTAWSANAKKQERESRHRAAAEAWQPPPVAPQAPPPQASPPAYVPLPTAPFTARATPTLPPVPRRQVRPPPVPRSKRRKSTKPPQPAPLHRSDVAAAAEAATPAGPRAAHAPARPAAPPGLDARTLAAWLRPEVMRRQFILTEVFDPPPALRQDS